MDISRPGVLWLVAGAGAAIVALLFWFAGLTVRSDGSQLFLWVSAPLLCFFYRPPDRSWQQKLLDSIEYVALLSLISTIGAFATYAVAALTTGYSDDFLAAMDRALGFDWIWFYNLSQDHAWLSIAGRVSYLSIFISPTILVLALAWTGRRIEARRFLFAFAIALAVTVLIAAFFLARGAIEHHVGPTPSYMPQAGVHHAQIIQQLREGTLTYVDPTRLAGLLTFPSFHATSAILFIWAAWPIRWLRGPMLAMNLAMLAATPIEGGHYLIDVFGGAFTAWLGVLALRLVSTGAPRPAPVQAPAPATAGPVAFQPSPAARSPAEARQ